MLTPAPIKRLYFFTGKGGTGKSLLSGIFCRYLQSVYQKNAKIVFIEPGSYQGLSYQDFIHLDLPSSIQKYLGLKLGPIVAKGILKTPFFSSALQMAPGFHYLVYMGDLLYRLKADPQLVLIFDSPSSGHTLTLFQSLGQFKKIFQKGILFDDIKVMEDMLAQDNFYQINLCSIPDKIPMLETIELKDKLLSLGFPKLRICMNRVFSMYPNSTNLPLYWQHKLTEETQFLQDYKSLIQTIIPYQANVDQLSPIYLENLL